MKKCSTPAGDCSGTNSCKNKFSEQPRPTTIAFICQFARVYRPAPASGMPGIILN